MTNAVRILVVDDSPNIRAVLRCILTSMGCEVMAADGVRGALRVLRTFAPDVILTDFNMPGLNGEAFVRLVRRDVRLLHLPVLVVSSESDVGIRERMVDAGADAWFDKPVDVRRLTWGIQEATTSGRAIAPDCTRLDRTRTDRARPGRARAAGGVGLRC